MMFDKTGYVNLAYFKAFKFRERKACARVDLGKFRERKVALSLEKGKLR